MKQALLVLTACSALVVAYFVSSVVLKPAGASAEAQAAPKPATQPSAAAAAAKPAPEPPKLTALLPDSPGFYNLQLAAKVGGKAIALPCRVFIPREYDKNKEARPLLVFLHGEDERGTDLAALTKVGPEKKLREDQGFRDNCRAIVVSPQCPPGATWDDGEMASAVLALVDELSKAFRIDRERISLTGHGMGAAGAWRVAALDPDRFAALAMSAPKGVLEAPLASKLKHVFSYVAAPQNDKPAYEAYCRTVEALGKARAEVQPRVATNNVKECYQWFYSDNSNYDWINQKKRRTADERRQRDERDAKELADAFTAIPKTPGEYRLKFVTWVGDKKVETPYQLFLPRGYDASPSPWPAIVFLSGAGEMNPDLSAINSHGPVAHMHEDPKFKEWFPFIVISPIHDNSPERARALVELIDFLEKAARIDADRVFATGLSLGGTTTWTVACAGPDKFAAIVPINGRQRCEDVAAQALKYVTSWIIVGGADGDFYTGSCKMSEILTAAGNDVHLTVIPGEGHGSWPRYYTDRRFYDWMLQHRRLTAAERAERDRHPVPGAAQALAKAEQFHEVMQPGHHWLEFATQLGGKPYSLRYALYLPKGYDPATANKWPLMLCLHGDEHRSTDQSLIFDWGSDVDPRRDERSRPGFPMIGLAPQLPQDRQWSDPEVMKMTLALIDEVGRRVRVDADRVYLTGVQNGGSGAWALALEQPDRFAALFPYQSGVVKPEEAAKKLKQVAAKVMAPKEDGGAVNNAKQMVEAMKKGGATAVEVAIVPQAQDANAWLPYYTDPQLVGWLMQHRRGK